MTKGLQSNGTCVMRSNALLDPRSWRGWGGDARGFAVPFVSAYTMPPGTEAMVTPEKMSERFDASQAAMDALHERIVAAKLDVLLIVGDDQTELFRTSNNPAMAIFYGPTIRNTAREPTTPTDPWPKTARMWRHEPEVDREYPVQSDLAEWLMQQGIDSISLNPDTVIETWTNLGR